MSKSVPDESELQIRINRTGFLAGRNMREKTYPTFDASIEWPVPFSLNHLTSILAAATPIYSVLYRPKAGFHGLVVRASLELLTGGNDRFRLIFRRSSDLAASQTSDLILNGFDGTNSNMLPLVGVFSALNMLQLQGVKPVYVPSGYDCGLLQTSTNGDTTQLNWLIVEYPETQPLTTLGTFF